jgi:hypothetical protein
MAQRRTTLVEFTQFASHAGERYNPGDVVRLPRRLAHTVVQSRRGRIVSDGAVETGSTVADLYESARRGLRGSATRPRLATKADGVPEAKENAPETLAEAAGQGLPITPGINVEATTLHVIAGLGDMTVIQLRERLRDAGMDDSGKKARLISRLTAHLLSDDDDDGEI